MTELDRALADIEEIRSRIAASSDFLGLGPVALATTGALALAVAALQTVLPGGTEPVLFFSAWVITALLSLALIFAEMIRRAHQHHSGLSDAMIRQAVLAFMPAAVAGGGLLVFMARFAPDQLWLMPGLWQILVATGIFAASRMLPPAIVWGAAWYFVCGFATLMLAAQDHALSPWAMGLPFAVGQAAIALIVLFGKRGVDAAG